MKNGIKTLPLLVFILASCIAHSPLKSPTEIVALFDKTYGTPEMSDIAPHTTGKFRDDKPMEAWVIDTWKALKNIKYERLNSEFIDFKIEGDKAVVILQTEYSSAGGKANQKEVFYLIKEDDIWKIDKLIVADEEVEGKKGYRFPHL